MRSFAYSEYPVLGKRCVALGQAGYKQVQIAQLLGCSQQWVSTTLRNHAQHGEAVFTNRKPPGLSPGLNQAQRQELVEALNQGAEAHGFFGQVWTKKRVGIVIEKLFGIGYEASQVGRILKKVGWSKQKPQRRAIKQDAQAVAQWQQETVPELKKRRRLRTRQ